MFEDPSSGLKNRAELKYARERGFFDKSRGVRLIIALIFVVGLFLFLHFRDVRVDVLELNSRATKYIVAQVNFDFYDQEATLIDRNEAGRDIGKIYRINEKDIRSSRADFEEYLARNQGWRDGDNPRRLAEIYSALDALETLFNQLRFTDARTFRKMHELGLNTYSYIVYVPDDGSSPTLLPPQTWNLISRRAFKERKDGQVVRFLSDFFREQKWAFQDDIPAQRSLLQQAHLSIEDKYTHVSAGNRIINQGDKVTPRHLAMLQAMKVELRKQSDLQHPIRLLGSFIMALLFTAISAVYLRLNHPTTLRSNRKLFLLITIILVTLGLSKLTEYFLLSSMGNLIEVIRYPVFVPLAAIMLVSLLNTTIATFATGFLVILLATTLSFDAQGFMIVNLTAAMTAMLATRSLRHRKEVFSVCAQSWLAAVVALVALNLYNDAGLGLHVVTDMLSSLFFMGLTAVMIIGLMPLLESLFGIMTDVTLMEYMDPNNELLRRLSIEAPGTYQHSVVVGNLAEAAALAIDANGLFCRVSTLYHDIGKTVTPHYFIENQQAGMNIHQLLTPHESAQVIIAHISEGVAMARKAGLPEQFIDIIKEHHGTTLVYLFYKKQLEKMGGDTSEVDEKDFRYSGPKPRSKESAIIMLADSLEAASRSIEVVDDDAVMELATRLIKEKADDGQLDECLLTFEELAIVKETLVKTLCAFAHSRIKYPKREASD